MEKGIEILVGELKDLISECERGCFDDFGDNGVVFPKNTLAQKLYNLRENVINGEYDHDKSE